MTDSRVLWGALDWLDDGRRWTKGSPTGSHSDEWIKGKACVLGAIAEARGENRLTWTMYDHDSSVLLTLSEVVDSQFHDRIGVQDGINKIWCFNDHPRTTYDDVRLVLEKAAIQLDEVL